MRLEKPLYTLLLASLALTLLTVLQPHEAETPTGSDELLSDRPMLPAKAEPVIRSWRRPLRTVAVITPATAATSSAASLPPPPGAPANPPSLPPIITEIPPSRPVTPAPEFSYVGRLNREDKTWIFIIQGGNSYAVPLGDTFEGRWRFDAVQADRLDLTYLPLREPRSLSLRKE